MLCFYLRTKSLKVIDNIITNFRLMILGKKNFVLDDAFVDLKVFSDIHKFSHRIDCINMVLKGLEEALG